MQKLLSILLSLTLAASTTIRPKKQRKQFARRERFAHLPKR